MRYDAAKGVVRKAGGESNILVFRNITKDFINDSINRFVKELENSQILMLPGGFSSGDEPDGSGKFIASANKSIHSRKLFLSFRKDGLILGICNGFQALIKSGLLPYGEIGK